MPHFRPIHSILTALAMIPFLSACGADQPQSTVVSIQQTDSGVTLLKDGEPYTILGVGGTTNLDLLASHGGNTIRTWGADGIESLMDDAHANGISVVIGLWLKHERHGYDYSDPAVKQSELADVEKYVRMYRDHPALLAWGVGNEVELGGSMDTAIQQINDAAALVKSLDPNHPTMAVIAEIGDDKALRIQNECPDIDMLGINSYGGLGSLGQRIKDQGVTLPYTITEFGPVGHWETGNTAWGAPYEQSGSSKAEFLRNNYLSTIQPNLGKQCLGSFAFLWGFKQEKTATWYGLLLETGETTESVDVLQELWTGTAPENGAPRVRSMSLDANAAAIPGGSVLEVQIDAEDPDGDQLVTEWSVLPESRVVSAGGDFEDAIQAVDVEIKSESPTKCLITMPTTEGAYRIFATVRDQQGHAGTVNLPVYVIDQE
ncbi:MAG: hypothetical protein JJ974_03790 [Phycisphaerales bacterium]|nr:hypothetical protein [Phycisphaerales bacterium]